MAKSGSEAPLSGAVSLVRLADILRFASVLGNANEEPTQGASRPGQGPSANQAFPGVDFREAVSELFRVLKERRVRYLLVGGVALLRYVPGRNTEDIDLLLAVNDLALLPELELQERSDWFAKGQFQGLRVDLLFTANPFFNLVLDRYATLQPFLELSVPCASAEGLLLLKLYALPSLYRQGDLQKANLYEADIAALLLEANPDLELIFRELSPFLSGTDLAELRKIVAEARLRPKRFG